MVITHHVEFPPMLCRDGVQQKQVKVRGGIRWIITTEKTREIRCSHCNRLLAKGECSILSGNAPVRDPLHTVCHSILYSKFFIPKLNGVVHKIVWRVTMNKVSHRMGSVQGGHEGNIPVEGHALLYCYGLG